MRLKRCIYEYKFSYQIAEIMEENFYDNISKIFLKSEMNNFKG